jgi:CheY-like chemotaxis protein
MNLRILFVEDEEKIRSNLVKIFDGETIGEHVLIADSAETFEIGMEKVSKIDYDIVILDLCKGEPNEASEKPGYDILKQIQSLAFVPVIFYSGLTKDLMNLSSEVIGIVNKGDGVEKLKSEIERIISSKIALLKGQIYSHLRESLRQYFWETVHAEKKVFEPIKNDISLGYLLLRRFANSLSKENIKQLLGDDKIKTDKAHPMEFYIYPVNPDSSISEYQAGEILEKDGIYYVTLTPDCDFILRYNGLRKADKILLAVTKKFIELPDYAKYRELKDKKDKSEKENQQLSNIEGKLKTWMSNRGGEQDRYFFLPSTPFIENLVIDFQNKMMVDYNELKSFNRVAKLDLPYAQSMISSFIRYYNRIGFPDIDTEYVLNNL